MVQVTILSFPVFLPVSFPPSYRGRGNRGKGSAVPVSGRFGNRGKGKGHD